MPSPVVSAVPASSPTKTFFAPPLAIELPALTPAAKLLVPLVDFIISPLNVTLPVKVDVPVTARVPLVDMLPPNPPPSFALTVSATLNASYLTTSTISLTDAP